MTHRMKNKFPGIYKLLKKVWEKKTLLKRMKNPTWFYLLRKKNYPLSDQFGFDRGGPIDRYYIEKFLEKNKGNIKGNCLEVLNNLYTTKFGQNITKSDILDIDTQNKKATIIGDLRNLKNIYDNTYDCILLTQVLQFIDDYDAAIRECKRILKRNGALLVTLPCISRIDCRAKVDGDFWRFTKAGAQYIFRKYFENTSLEIIAYGNCFSGLAFWVGMGQDDVRESRLDYFDENFPVLICIKAIKL